MQARRDRRTCGHGRPLTNLAQLNPSRKPIVQRNSRDKLDLVLQGTFLLQHAASIRRAQPIADPGFGQDVFRLRDVVLDLLPQQVPLGCAVGALAVTLSSQGSAA
jgi:hypothetical protein